MSKKLNIQEIKERLKIINSNIEILSEEYIEAKTKLKCKCKIDGYEWEMNWNKLQRGRGCPLCAGNIKLNINEIKIRLKEINPNIVIISNEYCNNRTKLTCKCNIDGYIWNSNWGNLQQGVGCPKCSKNAKLNLEGIKKTLMVINPNIEILSESYTNSFGSLRCKCIKDGYEWDTFWTNLKSGHGCPMCFGNVKLTLEEIKEKLKIISPNIEILSNKYINAKSKIKCRCRIDGYIWESTWTTLQTGSGCMECANRDRSGKNSYLWKGGISPLASYLRHSIKQWKVDSFKQTNYKCYITGLNKNLQIHHIYNFADIIQETLKTTNIKICSKINEYSIEELELLERVCLELHYKYGLGVCLTKEIHKEFHKKYGKINNTKEQFEEFKNSYEIGGEILCQDQKVV